MNSCCVFSVFFHLFLSQTEKEEKDANFTKNYQKLWESAKKINLTSERHAEGPFAGQNTQQI